MSTFSVNGDPWDNVYLHSNEYWILFNIDNWSSNWSAGFMVEFSP